MYKGNRSTKGYSKLKRSVNVKSSGMNGLKSNIGEDQVSGVESVLCWLAVPIANPYGNFPELGYNVKNVHKVQFGNKVRI